MRVIVFGAGGQIGSVIARELSTCAEIDMLGIADVDAAALGETMYHLDSDRIIFTYPLKDTSIESAAMILRGFDVDNARLMELGYDVAVLALPVWDASYRVIEAAIREGVQVVDILEEYHRRPDPDQAVSLPIPEGMTPDEYGDDLHRRAQEAGITVLDGMGFAPGLTNILLGEGIRALDEAHEAIARAGGVPNQASAQHHPFNYMITWAFDHVLREYTAPSIILEGGELVEAAPLSGRESFRFTALERDVKLEAAITPGMPSFVHTRPDLLAFAEKTIRWPGHWAAVDVLVEAGLLAEEPVNLGNDITVTPRAFLAAVLEPQLKPRPGDVDACIMWNSVTGLRDGQPVQIDTFMWEEADLGRGLSAMARVTAFPAAIGALLLGRGLITEKGVISTEDGIHGAAYAAFMQELEARGIQIEWRETAG